MKFDFQEQMEGEIARELRELGELTAPHTLIARVLREIERRAQLVWYRRAWPTWPIGLRVASFAGLALLFGGLCAAAWLMPNSAVGTEISGRVSQQTGPLITLLGTLQALSRTLVLALQQVNTGVLIGGAIALVLGYALVIGLGASVVRLAWQGSTTNYEKA